MHAAALAERSLQKGAGLLLVVALHATLLLALLAHKPRSDLAVAAPVMVHIAGVSAPREPASAIDALPPPRLMTPSVPFQPIEIPIDNEDRGHPATRAPQADTSSKERPESPPAVTAPVTASRTPSAATALIAPVFDADYLDNQAPAYPAISRRLGEQGRVLLRVLVTPHGRAARVELHESSGFARLDDAAREAVKAWTFLPARRGEERLAAWVLIPVSFRLEA